MELKLCMFSNQFAAICSSLCPQWQFALHSPLYYHRIIFIFLLNFSIHLSLKFLLIFCSIVKLYSSILTKTYLAEFQISPAFLFCPQLFIFLSLWWGDPGWMPRAQQSHSFTPLLSCTGERKQNKGS